MAELNLEDRMRQHEHWLLDCINRNVELHWRLKEANEIVGSVKVNTPEAYFRASSLLYQLADLTPRARGEGVNLNTYYVWLAKDYFQFGEQLRK